MKRAVARHLLISGIVLAAVVVGFLVWVFVFPTRFGRSIVSDISTSAIPKEKIDQSHVEYLAATDGVRLAYRAYVPGKPVAIVIFYHGFAGYLLVCPDFGRKSDTVRLAGPNSFVSVITKPFVVNSITHGLLMAHTYDSTIPEKRCDLERA